MSHELAEKTAGLASRVNNLAVNHSGESSRRLLEQQDRLTKLELVAIVKDLNDEREDYKKAIEGLNKAINAVGEADKKIQKIADTLTLIKKAADLVENALKTAGR